MKNKIKLIDLNILSLYMGKFLTTIVALLVLGITVSAFISDRIGGDGGILHIAFSLEDADDQVSTSYEPFRNLVSSETRRAVRLTVSSNAAAQADLHVMSLNKYLRTAVASRLVPIFSIAGFEGNRDAAVIIATERANGIDYSKIPPSRVVFTDSLSANGFWTQLEILEKGGFRLPESMNQLHFEGSGAHAVRVVFGVLWGRYTLGACRLSDLVFLVSEGLLGREEVRIIAKADAVPEILVAVRQEKADYFIRILTRIGKILSAPNPPANKRRAIEQLKANGIMQFVPIEEGQMERVQELAGYMESRF